MIELARLQQEADWLEEEKERERVEAEIRRDVRCFLLHCFIGITRVP